MKNKTLKNKNNKKNLKYLSLSLLTLGLAVPSIIFPISCSSQPKHAIKSFDIVGKNELYEKENLSLTPSIVWSDNFYPGNITYNWTIKKNDGSKINYSTKNLFIQNIDMSYDKAIVELSLNIEKYSPINRSIGLIVHRNNQNDKISFKTSSVRFSSVSDIEAKTLWNDNSSIEKLIIQHKTFIFNINDSSFDLNRNLEILQVNKNQNESDNGILTVSIRVNNATIDNKSIQSQLTISGFKFRNNQGDKISFKNNNVVFATVSNIEASTLWNNTFEIKKLIIQHKSLIFNIIDSNFDFNTNLEILSVSNNQTESDQGKLVVQIRVNNATANNQSIDSSLTISGFKTKNSLDQTIENYDFFVLPGKDSNIHANRITNPFTKNKDVIQKYGNAPLPWVDDDLLTSDDIVNMFTYLCLYAKACEVNFGQRKINANLFISAFFEWSIKYRKYFPYKSFDNTPPYFYGISDQGEFSSEINSNTLNSDEYVNHRTWYIHRINWPNFDEVYQPGIQRDDFLRFVTKLFRYVQPNMTDVEKLFMCENFVMNWLYYDGKKETEPYDNRGVCTDYANLLAYALNILDVPSVKLDCGSQAEPHAIVWTYLDLYGNGEKKWYASDMTLGDFDDAKSRVGCVEGLAALALPSDRKGWYLFDVGVSQFEPIDGVNGSWNPWQHDISNKVYGLPWSDIGQNKSPIGIASYGTEDNYAGKYFKYMFSTRYKEPCIRSRVFYINGESYYFERNPFSPYGVSLYKTKALIGATKQEVPIELDSRYMDKFSFDKQDGDNYETTYPPLVQQYGNKIAILLNPKKSHDSNYQRSILLINTTSNGIDWKNVQEFTIPSQVDGVNLNDNYIFNMDIEWDGMLRLDYAPSYKGLNNITIKNIKLDLGQQFKNTVLFNANLNNRKGDFDIAKQYFIAIVSAFRIAEDKNGYIPFSLRQEFIDYMNQQSTNHNYYQAIVNVYNKFIEISEKVFATSNTVLQSKLLNNVYMTSLENFKQYGYSFQGFDVFSNPDDMVLLSNSNVKYDVYFSNKKPSSANDLNSFTKIINNADHPYADMAALEKAGYHDPNGYYFFEIVSKKSKIRTNVCELQANDLDLNFESRLNYYGISTPTNSTTRITNYIDSVPNWYDDPISFNFQIYYNQLFKDKYDFNIELKYINVDSKEIKTIKDNEYFKQHDKNNGAIKAKIELEQKPNNDNHGIYYLDITAINKQTRASIKFYSQFSFIFTLDDYNNWNCDLWAEAIDKISIYK